MKISVALCTYNGEKFLREQLDSIAAQTRLPDEIIVCDDCSTDRTRDILTSFAADAPFPVKLFFNEQNLGYLKNFAQAIELCAGEIIVLSDQDDVWREDKLALIENEFAKSEKIGMVYADAEVVDESLAPMALTMWERRGFNAEKQDLFVGGKGFEILLTDGYVYGSSLAFRSQYRELILPFPENTFFIHDNWIALMISAVADVALVKELLIKYRQHIGQTVGIKVTENSKLKLLVRSGQRVNEYEGHIRQLKIAEQRLRAGSYPAEKQIAKIEAARKHLSARAELPKNPAAKFLTVCRELAAGNYHHYSNGLRSAVKDLLAR